MIRFHLQAAARLPGLCIGETQLRTRDRPLGAMGRSALAEAYRSQLVTGRRAHECITSLEALTALAPRGHRSHLRTRGVQT
jgi:hypothetical protein